MELHDVRGGSAWDVAIIGAGIGGLTTAALLAQAGARVIVCEQHNRPGGFCHSWERIVRCGDQRHRFIFDAAVHDISGVFDGGPVPTILARLGLQTAFDWARVDHEYEVRSGRFTVGRDVDAYIASLVSCFPAEAVGIATFFALLRRCYDELYRYARETGGLPVPPRNATEISRFLTHCPTLTIYMHRPFVQVRDTVLHDPALRQLVAVLAVYVTDDVEQLSFANMLPLYGYYFRGGYYPRGGSQHLANMLVQKLESHGGQLRLRAAVANILVQKKRAVGLVLRDGTELQAGIVISNADPVQSFGPLLAPGVAPDRLLNAAAALRPSNSAFMVYLALNKVPDLAATTIVLDGQDGLMISCPPFREQRAPPGYTTLTLTGLIGATHVPDWRRKDTAYAQMKRDEGDRLIGLAVRRFPELGRHIVYRQEGTPATLMRYTWASGGAAYGLTPGTRWQRHDTPLEHLYLVGASTGLGSGIEAVMVGAAALAERLGTGASLPSSFPSLKDSHG